MKNIIYSTLFFVASSCFAQGSLDHFDDDFLRILVTEDSSYTLLHDTSDRILNLKEIVITSRTPHLNVIAKVDLLANPVTNSQEVLRKVPGLFIGQHAGGGKAEQLFLRGFDIDHGTDVTIAVDGMPVNMVSHAHGQGYADLHFLIPETIDQIDFDKGAYNASKGNFNTAGYVGFVTKERVDHSVIAQQVGMFNTFRSMALLNLQNNERNATYFASEWNQTDNFFDAPQAFNRLNLMAKHTSYLDKGDKVSVSASHFKSKWDASGQIPDRAVADKTIGFYGAIDNTEGGATSRTNVNLQYLKNIAANRLLRTSAYFSRYDFELYSNFTFFKNDPINGDQIKQKEGRNMYGTEAEYGFEVSNEKVSTAYKIGAGLRADEVNEVELSRTVNRRTTLQHLALGNVTETNLYAFAKADINIGNWTINPGLRVDRFRHAYQNELDSTYVNKLENLDIVSPKLNFIYTPSTKAQYFLKLGKGFHTNDSRVVVAQQANTVLPASYGGDLGLLWKPAPQWLINSALWYLFLEQEFVYVGDEAIVEPSGKTQRVGFDLGVRYQPTQNWFIYADYTYSHGKALEEPEEANRIPLAPRHTFAGGINYQYKRFVAGLSARHLGDRAAVEDNSIVAKGYIIFDCNINYQVGNITFGLIAQNVLNTRWKETQFATESQLRNESAPVEEIHFTPGTPFSLRGSVSYLF